MEITTILSKMKGKVLDATNFDLLKSAYDLQSENIKQLKESNSLLKEKVERLEKENKSLSSSLKKLKEQIPSTYDPSCISNLSDMARDILKLYLSMNTTKLFRNIMLLRVSNNKIKIDAALNELIGASFIYQTQEYAGEGMVYILTDLGTKCLSDGLLS